MGKEIEVKYIVSNAFPREEFSNAKLSQQVYLTNGNLDTSVRVNILGHLTRGFDGTLDYNPKVPLESYINIKGRRTGCIRNEFEYRIDPKDAKHIFKMVSQGKNKVFEIVKVRYLHDTTDWVVDQYFGVNVGLIVGEREFDNPADAADFSEIPSWCVKNITGQDKFYNARLFKNPFCFFKDRDRYLDMIYSGTTPVMSEEKLFNQILDWILKN